MVQDFAISTMLIWFGELTKQKQQEPSSHIVITIGHKGELTN